MPSTHADDALTERGLFESRAKARKAKPHYVKSSLLRKPRSSHTKQCSLIYRVRIKCQ